MRIRARAISSTTASRAWRSRESSTESPPASLIAPPTPLPPGSPLAVPPGSPLAPLQEDRPVSVERSPPAGGDEGGSVVVLHDQGPGLALSAALLKLLAQSLPIHQGHVQPSLLRAEVGATRSPAAGLWGVSGGLALACVASPGGEGGEGGGEAGHQAQVHQLHRLARGLVPVAPLVGRAEGPFQGRDAFRLRQRPDRDGEGDVQLRGLPGVAQVGRPGQVRPLGRGQTGQGFGAQAPGDLS